VNTDVLLQRFDEQVRRDLVAEPGFRVERTHRVVRVIGAWNCVLFADLDEQSAEPVIASEIAHFSALGEPLQWKVYAHDQPRGLAARLERAGFVPTQPETLMLLDLEHASLATHVPPGFELRRLGAVAELEAIATIGREAFDMDISPLIAEFEARLPLGTLAFYIAYDGRVPVAAGRLELPPYAEFAGLYGGGTVPRYRRRGIYRSLVTARALEARERGYRYLIAEAAAASRPILEKIGFVAISTVSTWRWTPS